MNKIIILIDRWRIYRKVNPGIKGLLNAIPKIKNKLLDKLTHEKLTHEKLTHKEALNETKERILRYTKIDDKIFYENQIDFSRELKTQDVKVLSYYLPQFHIIPENNLWHGRGFTEWTNVKSSSPYFKGHNQPPIPHSDIGYYKLSTPKTLELQFDQMRKSGVYGQIFYHYWFNGKLLLEKPAKMLLESKHIKMPFCFCWANENWTKTWDGNNKNILLEQNYSAKDALAFILYLIPFFKDKRYIKFSNRPVLFIYRPLLIDDLNAYISIWNKACASHNLQAPYLIGVLKDDLITNKKFKLMDAIVERPLHDWLDGKINSISSFLQPKMKSKVLLYDDVANFYIKNNSSNKLIPSVLSNFDNSPRYDRDSAHIVFGSTPKKFQEWLTSAIENVKKKTLSSNRFIVINAWNEWAESMHLEPDDKFGYAYLNSVGRALTNKKFKSVEAYSKKEIKKRNIVVMFDLKALKRLKNETYSAHLFFEGLKRAKALNNFNLLTFDTYIYKLLSKFNLKITLREKSKNRDPVTFLKFDDLYLVSDGAINSMIQMLDTYPRSIIWANILNNPAFTFPAKKLLNFDYVASEKNGISMYTTINLMHSKICIDADAFQIGLNNINTNEMFRVSTILRLHKIGGLKTLYKALLCLLSQSNTLVKPYIALQGFKKNELQELTTLLKKIPWYKDCKPIIKQFKGNKDIRSDMLNKTLMTVKSGFVAFLDFDDILYPNAYFGLASRLEKSGKNSTFGRVFSSISDNGLIVERKKEYLNNKTYYDFLFNNFIPIHSYMIDLDKINLNEIRFMHGMTYMEDYYLALQIFNQKNSDWESFNKPIFIGDYIYNSQNTNTLGLYNQKLKKNLLKYPKYIRDQKNIDILRAPLLRKILKKD